jgi:hypothetical protein
LFSGGRAQSSFDRYTKSMTDRNYVSPLMLGVPTIANYKSSFPKGISNMKQASLVSLSGACVSISDMPEYQVTLFIYSVAKRKEG